MTPALKRWRWTWVMASGPDDELEEAAELGPGAGAVRPARPLQMHRQTLRTARLEDFDRALFFGKGATRTQSSLRLGAEEEEEKLRQLPPLLPLPPITSSGGRRDSMKRLVKPPQRRRNSTSLDISWRRRLSSTGDGSGSGFSSLSRRRPAFFSTPTPVLWPVCFLPA